MATKTAPRRRRQPAAAAKTRTTNASTSPASIPAQAAAPGDTTALELPEADRAVADAADRAADLRDLAAADAARILADGQARAAELLDGARTEAASITEAATAEQTRILAAATTDADQAAEQLLADARRQAADAVTTAASEADRVRAAAERDAAKVVADAETARTELLATAERTASETRSRAAVDADQLMERVRGAAADARTEADRIREGADVQAAQIRAAAEKAAVGIRQDADRALDDARTSADNLRAVVDKDVERLREQAASDTKTAREAAAKATTDQAAAAQARKEAEQILERAASRTVQRNHRRELRQESRIKRRKARQDARPAGGVPPLSGQELVGAIAIVLAAATVSTLGLLSSYTALEHKAAGWGWDWPWLLPVGIDVAIPAFTGANLFLIRMGMELRWVRWVPRVLTAVTVYLNWNASTSTTGRIGHATLTLLWVAFSEIASHMYATRIGAVTGKVRMETVRRSRWLLAPIPTARLRRRMILWEITSYTEALTRLQEQTYLRAQLKEEHGWLWRWKAPLDQRMALKLGEVPAALADTLTPQDAHTIECVEETERAHPGVSALTSGNARGKRERPALISGAHAGERATEDDDAHRAESTRTRSESDALTERRHERIRLLYPELGRRPEWTEIRDALTDAGLSETPVSRPTAQRLRAQVEEGTPSAPVSAGASA